MRAYKFVPVKYDTGRIGFASLEEHRAVIEKQAEQGYRYVGMIPTLMSSNGLPLAIDLVFEREE